MELTLNFSNSLKPVIKVGDEFYYVSENAKSWRVFKESKGLTVNFKVPKNICANLEELENFIQEEICG